MTEYKKPTLEEIYEGADEYISKQEFETLKKENAEMEENLKNAENQINLLSTHNKQYEEANMNLIHDNQQLERKYLAILEVAYLFRTNESKSLAEHISKINK